MIFGGVDQERLQLNEDTLWAGGPYDPVNPTAKAALPEVRQLIFDGKYEENARHYPFSVSLCWEYSRCFHMLLFSHLKMFIGVLLSPWAPGLLVVRDSHGVVGD